LGPMASTLTITPPATRIYFIYVIFPPANKYNLSKLSSTSYLYSVGICSELGRSSGYFKHVCRGFLQSSITNAGIDQVACSHIFLHPVYYRGRYITSIADTAVLSELKCLYKS
jgi:hypothetical protein